MVEEDLQRGALDQVKMDKGWINEQNFGINLDLKLRPQNLDFDTYYKMTIEYEKLGS